MLLVFISDGSFYKFFLYKGEGLLIEKERKKRDNGIGEQNERKKKKEERK
jgi:hypothetical protein